MKRPDQSVVVVDVDETLIMWDRSEYPRDKYEWFTSYFMDPDEPIDLVINTKNVNLLKKFAKLDYRVIVWSRSGEHWARHIGGALGLDKYVHSYMSKPLFYFDDKPADEWMERIWRHPDSKPQQIKEVDNHSEGGDK